MSLGYQSEVSILGPVGYGPTTLPLRHSDVQGETDENLGKFFSIYHFSHDSGAA
jgi:hypothetical protein